MIITIRKKNILRSVRYALVTVMSIFGLMMIDFYFIFKTKGIANIFLILMFLMFIILFVLITESVLRAYFVHETIEFTDDSIIFISNSRLPIPWFNSKRIILYKNIKFVMINNGSPQIMDGAVQIFICGKSVTEADSVRMFRLRIKAPFSYWINRQEADSVRELLKNKNLIVK